MKILLTGALKYSQEQLKKISAYGLEILYVQDERKTLEIDVSEIEFVVCNSLFLYNEISKFENLKLIQLTSAGMDRVPIDYIREHNIQLFNARGVYSAPMAEWAILKILELYKGSQHFYKAQSKNKWLKKRDLFELSGKTASIIGFGSVGREVAKRLKAFDVFVIGIDINKIESEFADEAVMLGGLDTVLNKTDIVILTLPYTKETHHLMNKSKLEQLKEHSIVINISRGGVIDEKALAEVLESGKLFGAALDVFEEEPLPENSPLWKCENVVITPHNSFVSDKVNDRMFDLMYKNLGEYTLNAKGKEHENSYSFTQKQDCI